MKVRIAILVLIHALGAARWIQAQADYLKEAETKARDLLQKAVEAMGGDAYLKLQDVHRTGRFYQFRKDDLQGTGHFQAFEKFPSKSRFELGKKGEIININDGDNGWKIEYKVVKDQSPEEIRISKRAEAQSGQHPERTGGRAGHEVEIPREEAQRLGRIGRGAVD